MSTDRPKLLIVDDQDRYVELAHALLRDYDYATRCELTGPCWDCDFGPGCTLTHAHNWSETMQALARHPDVDVVLLDCELDLPREQLLIRADQDEERSRRLQGIEILRRLRQRQGNLPVVLMTSREELRYEEEAEELAVDEFVTMAGKDAFDARALGLLVERIMARQRSEEQVLGYIWGRSKAMARVRRDALILARTSLPILLVGESGTGKSALVEKVLAVERRGELVVVDLAAIPETLVAAELFGTVRGAFSGATDRVGSFARADGGTLFLDEIGNLSPDVQRLLLVTLQSGRVSRLGEGQPREVDVKLIAATNSDLAEEVRAGRFRADLYARLNPTASLKLVPLRERSEDLVELARAFVQRTFESGADRALLSSYIQRAELRGPVRADLSVGSVDEQEQGGVVFVLHKRTLAELKSHPFPGNIRELELLVASAAVYALSDAMQAAEKGRTAPANAARSIPLPAKLIRELIQASWVEQKPASRTPKPGPGPGMWVKLTAQDRLHSVTRDMERQVLLTLFQETGGDFRAMASQLLTGDPSINERRVRLRFNQLGLRARELRGKSS